MGLLTQFIQHRYREEENKNLTSLEAYKSILTNDKATPQAKEYAYEQLMKTGKVKGDTRNLFDMVLKPLIHGTGKAGAKLGIPGSKKLETVGDTPDELAQSRTKKIMNARGPDAAGWQQSAKDKAAGKPDHVFYTPEEQAQQDKQEDARAIEKATKVAQAKNLVERGAELRNRAEDMEQIGQIRKDEAAGKITSEDAINKIMMIMGKEPYQKNWQPGAMIMPNGTPAGVMYTTKGTPQFLLGGTTPFTPPPGASSPKSWADYDREQEEKEPKKPTGELATRLEAQEIVDNPTKHTPSEVQAAKDTLKHLNVTEKGAEVRNEAAELKLKRIGNPMGARAEANSPETENEMRATALFELIGGDKPSYGLGKSSQRDLFNKQRSKLLAELGPANVQAMRLAAKAGGQELSQLMKSTGLLDAVESAFQYDIGNALTASQEVDRTSLKRFNTLKQLYQADLTDNPSLARFRVAAQTAANQYARIMVSAGRGSVTSDSARQHAEELLNAAMPTGAFEGALKQMNIEAQNMTKGLREATGRAQESIQAIGAPAGISPAAPHGGNQRVETTTGTRLGRPVGSGGGQVTMRAPDGSTRAVDASQVEHYKSLGATVVKQ